MNLKLNAFTRAIRSFVLLPLLSLAITAMAQPYPNITGTYQMVEIYSISTVVGGRLMAYRGTNSSPVDVIQTSNTFTIGMGAFSRTGVLSANTVTRMSGFAFVMPPGWVATTNVITSGYGIVSSNQTEIVFSGRATGTTNIYLFESQVQSHIWLIGPFHPLLPPSVTTQPIGLTNTLGTSATFSVVATGATPLIYQWRKAGLIIPDATNASYTINSITNSDAGSYTVQISNSVGKTNSSSVKLAINYPPSIATQPVKLVKAQLGAKVTLSVVAKGTGRLTYQWLRSGVTQAGATNSTYSFVAGPDENGSTNLIYTVSVSNAYGSILSSNAAVVVLPDIVLPKITLNQPAANSRINTTNFSGTASDNGLVVGVTYWVTNLLTGVVSAPVDINLENPSAQAKWQFNANMLPGTNILVVRSRDQQGNFSAPVMRKFFFQVAAPFTLSVRGDGTGTITASTIGGARDSKPIVGTTNLYIGQTYSLQAIANSANSFFTNWTGTPGVVTNAKLSFVMSEGFELQANFVTNLFIGMVGTYNGLFGDTNAISPQSSGMLRQFKVDQKGVYSGQLVVNGTSYPLSGAFDRSGQAQKTISRTAALGGPVTLKLSLQWNDTPRHIIGSVAAEGWTVPLTADLAGKRQPAARYTLLLPPSVDGTQTSPVGYGYILLTNNGANVSWSGVLADGTTLMPTVVPVSNEGRFPIYAGLYKGVGMLSGWIDLSEGEPSGELTWIKQASAGQYPQGFTNVTRVESSLWVVPPAKTPALIMTTNAPGFLVVSDGNLMTPLSFNVVLTQNNILNKTENSATNALTGSVDPKTGSFKVVVGSGKTAVTATGAILQSSGFGGGGFPGLSSAGVVKLMKNRP